MLGKEILLAETPRGKFFEGTVSGTPKPGTCMQVKAGVEPVGGRFTYEVYNPDADGNQRVVIVLLEDKLQGRLYSTAYADGDRGFFYVPAPGEHLNMLIADVAGTGDDWAIGDLLIIDKGTGKLIATTGSPESEPFQCMETVTDPAADHWMRCMYTGY